MSDSLRFAKIFLILSFGLWGHFSQAGLALEAGVVKIISSSPKSSTNLNGSGFLFTYRGLPLVLTSEHILIPETETDVLIQMKNQEGQILKLQVLKSDWGSGLALLRVEEPLSTKTLSDLTDLQTQPAPSSGPVISAGFPAASDGILIDPDGVLTNLQSHFELFLDVPYLLEVHSALTEFGMSGGLLLSEDLRPLGILSHKSGSAADLTYVIPLSYALAWVQETIDQADFKAYITRMNIDTGEEDANLNSGNFRLWRNAANELRMFYLSLGEISLTKNFPHVMFTDADRLCAAYFRRSRDYAPYVYLYGFRKKGLLNLKSKMTYPASLLGMFKFLKDPTLQPVAYVWSGNEEHGDNGTEHLRLRNEMDLFFENSSQAYNKLPLMPYLSAVKEVLDSSPSSDESVASLVDRLSPHDIDFVLNDPSLQGAWQELKDQDPALAVKLRQNLQAVQKLVGAYVL